MFREEMIRLLISGGPGSGCTTTAAAVGERWGVPVFDSDSYFHKPTDPPFQEQYTPEERREMLGSLLEAEPGWILSGSVATWGLDSLCPTHGVFLDMPRSVRLDRLMDRQRGRFGSRIDPGGVMHEEHESFLRWSAEYDGRTAAGRNLTTDRAFLQTRCPRFISFTDVEPMDRVVSRVLEFLSSTTHAAKADRGNSAAHRAHPFHNELIREEQVKSPG